MNKPLLLTCNSTALAVALCLISAVSGRADSLFQEDNFRSQFGDKRARAIGDIITVVVQESTASSKQNNTKTDRSSGMDASMASFLFSPAASSLLTKGGKLPAMSMSSKNSFNGGGEINNSEKITTRFAVKVVDVLPNGSMVIEGKRQTKMSGETTDAVLRGVIRNEDVTAANTVFSYNVADATIQYASKGVVSDSQRKGWFSRVWDKVSPF